MTNEHTPWSRRTARRRPAVRRLPSALSRALHARYEGEHGAIEHDALAEGLATDGVVVVEGLLERDRCAHLERGLLRQLESRARPDFGRRRAARPRRHRA